MNNFSHAKLDMDQKFPTFLGRNHRDLNPDEKLIADREMDGSNFDCNKCGRIILAVAAKCMMGGKKGEIPDICWEFGAVCSQCFEAQK